MATGRVPTTANSPLTTKGDLFTYDTSQARLAVGSNGETLVADSSASVGLRWQGNYAAGKNKIINGDMNIWQRGTSYNVANAGPFYGAADRWRYYHNGSTAGTNTVSRQAFTVGQTDVPNNPSYFQRWTATTLGTSQTVVDFDQLIEDVSTFAGQTVTISFFVKASATFAYTIYLEQSFGSGGSSAVGTTMATGNTTTSWVKVTGTATLPSISGKTVGTGSNLRFLIRFSTPTAGATFDIANAQVEAGSTATAFQTATGTLAGELAACQRYYQRVTSSAAYGQLALTGSGNSPTFAYVFFGLKSSMRVSPTSVDFSAVALDDGVNSVVAVTALAMYSSSPDLVRLGATTASGLTTYRPYWLTSNNNSAGYVGISAEL